MFKQNPETVEQYSDLKGIRLLLVEDDYDMQAIVEAVADDTGFSMFSASSLEALKEIPSQEYFDIAVVDMVLPDANGIDIIKYLHGKFSTLPVIVITGYADQEMAYQLDCVGIQQVLTKPFSTTQLRFTMCQEIIRCKENGRCRNPGGMDVLTPVEADAEIGIVGNSDYIKSLREKIAASASSDRPVLVFGPPGTGKETVAGAIHRLSARAGKDMAVIDCKTIPEGSQEEVFFGTAPGSISEKAEEQCGVIEHAGGSTLFIDGVEELSFDMQEKILRIVDAREFLRIGESTAGSVDCRMIFAAGNSLSEMVADGHFREDLYKRLASGVIQTQPLYQHREDIPLIVRAYLYEAGKKRGIEYVIAGKAMGLLLGYHWPGNIHELRSVVDSLCDINRKTGTITAESIGWAISGLSVEMLGEHSSANDDRVRKYFISLLKRHNGNIAASAREALIDRAEFSGRLRALGIEAWRYRMNRKVKG